MVDAEMPDAKVQVRQSDAKVQVLFVIDVTEATGASWSLLQRACLAIIAASAPPQRQPQPPPARAAMTEWGLLLVEGGADISQAACSASGFTTDQKCVRQWLRSVMFNSHVRGSAALEGLAMASALADWDPDARRHAVLVTHGEPRPLSTTTRLPSRAALRPPATALPSQPPQPSRWTPVPEALAASRVTLSLVAPRAMPWLADLHAAVCHAAGTPIPIRAHFAEAPELLVASHLTAAPRAASAGGAAATKRRGGGASAAGDAPTAGGAGAGGSKRRRGTPANAGGTAACEQGHLSSASASTQQAAGPEPAQCTCMLWEGELSVQLPHGGSVGLGDASLMAAAEHSSCAHWKQAAVQWGPSLSVRVLDATLGDAHAQITRAVVHQREQCSTAGPLSGAALPLRLQVRQGKASELFARLRTQTVLAQLMTPTPRHATVIDAAHAGCLGGWIVPLPDADPASPSVEAPAVVARQPPSSLAPLAPSVGAAPDANPSGCAPSELTSALTMAVADQAQSEAIAAALGDEGRALFNSLRRKLAGTRADPDTVPGGAPSSAP